MAVKLGEPLKKQLSAVLEMAPNPNITLVKEAVAHGFYRRTSLLDVQSSLLHYFPSLSEQPRKLIITGVYNPETFQAILERLSEQGYYDTVKKAVWNNDLSILDPKAIDKQPAKPLVGELTPPKVEATARDQEVSLPIKPSETKQDGAKEELKSYVTPRKEIPIPKNIQESPPQQPPQPENAQITLTPQPLSERRLNRLPERAPFSEQIITKVNRRTIREGISQRNPLPRIRIPSLVRKSALDTATGAGILTRKGLTRGASGIGGFSSGLSKGILGLLGGGRRAESPGGSSIFSSPFGNSGLTGPRGFFGSFGSRNGAGGGAGSLLKAGYQKWLLVLLLFLVGFILLFAYLNSGSDSKMTSQPCPEGSITIRKEVVGLAKEADYYTSNNDEKITYTITVTSSGSCGKDFIVEDILSQDVDPDLSSITEGGQIQGRKITWQFASLTTKKLSYSVTPNKSDIWVSNQITVRYTASSSQNGPSGGAKVPSGGVEFPTQDNCGGKYKLGNPLGNFGDPSCNFSEDVLYTQLQLLDPINAKYWFDVVIKCESSYVPNAWADHEVVGTPDAGGAWGLVQMGRGKNGQYDHGDVVWQTQVSNAINYNNNLARKWRYWACARDRW